MYMQGPSFLSHWFSTLLTVFGFDREGIPSLLESVFFFVIVCVFFPSMLKLLGLEGVGVHVAGFDGVRDPRLPASANRQHLSPTHLLFTFSFVTFFPHQVPAGCINYLWEKDELIHC